MKLTALMILAIALAGCNTNSTSNGPAGETKTAADTSQSAATAPALNVSAHLIFEDGTLSPFDVLQNNDTIALWNTIIGEGSAMKPSNSTKLDITGHLEQLNLVIKNGEETPFDSTINTAARQFSYVIKNTGCSEVYVTISKKNKVLYNDTIPFQCGE
jgi:hypothetical protein